MAGHLADTHSDLDLKTRKAIVSEYLGLQINRPPNYNFQFGPRNSIPAIDGLTIRNGFACKNYEKCGYLTTSRKAVRVHCNDEHDWAWTKADPVHWTEVKLQTFFRVPGNAIHYFCVIVPEQAGEDVTDKRGRPKCQLIDDIKKQWAHEKGLILITDIQDVSAVQQKEKQEIYEVEELERELERFSKRCVYCYVCKYTSTDHLIAQCTAPGVQGVRKWVDEFIGSVQQKRSMERFSCCLHCYIPQAICEHWKHKEDKEERGRWEEDNSQECQYPDVIVPAFWSMMMVRGQAALDWLYEWAERDGYDIRDDTESERQWLGKKVEWGGIEGNNLIRAFKELASQQHGVSIGGQQRMGDDFVKGVGLY